MNYGICMTKDALHMMNDTQRRVLDEMLGQEMVLRLEVMIDFSLPQDYLAVTTHYKHGPPIYGGLDRDGRMST